MSLFEQILPVMVKSPVQFIFACDNSFFEDNRFWFWFWPEI